MLFYHLASRQKINDEFQKNQNLTDEETIIEVKVCMDLTENKALDLEILCTP